MVAVCAAVTGCAASAPAGPEPPTALHSVEDQRAAERALPTVQDLGTDYATAPYVPSADARAEDARLSGTQYINVHAKIMIVDGVAAVVGSSNFNRRSLDHDEEVVLVALDDEVAGILQADFDADLERSEQIDLTRWRNRSRRQKALELATTPLRRFF